ncbi:MAG: hypothetical protein HDR44_04570, partial [Allobaculum sp.]|nr:hypothetical protein [Allobaculum sp.]
YLIPIGVAIGLWLTFTKWYQLFYCFLACWTAGSGLLVNPIMQGTAAVRDYPLAQAIQEQVAENPQAWWLSLRDDLFQGLLLANGAKVVNGVNFYPDLEKWELLELTDEESFRAINRYAHFLVALSDQDTSVKSPSSDVVEFRINPEDFETLDIQYVIGVKTDGVLFTRLRLPYQIVFEDKKTDQVIFDLSVSLQEADNRKELQEAIRAKKQDASDQENGLESQEPEVERESYELESAWEDSPFESYI